MQDTIKVTQVKHRDRAVIEGQRCYFGSLEGFNEEMGPHYREPIEVSRARAVRNGHDQRWVNLAATVICGDPGFYELSRLEWSGAHILKLGDVVELEGERFKIERTHNHNFKLVSMQSVCPHCSKPDDNNHAFGTRGYACDARPAQG